MKLLILACLCLSLSAHAAIVERRIWIETAIDPLKEDMCQDKMKTWRCLFADRVDCQKAMKIAFAPCTQSVVPDLPEYIDSPETKAAANKVVTDCMTTELTKKYILALPREKMDEYNVCTGAVARSKPLNANLQKALDFSKTLTGGHCATGSFFRKCYSMQENACKEALDKAGLDCTMKMEADGVSVKSEEPAIQEQGRKITECTLQNLRKSLDATKKKLKDKDCE